MTYPARNHPPVKHQVLQLDVMGTPQSWMTAEEAASHYATGAVAWEYGAEPLVVLRGGWNAALGRQSTLTIQPIIALRGASKKNLFEVEPTVTRAKLFKRDRHLCAYCGQTFKKRDLTIEHVIPSSKGGLTTFKNTVSACSRCNSVKADRSPEQAGMPLLHLPYVPSRYEDFLLQGRSIRADVHGWLASKLPKNSRLN